MNISILSQLFPTMFIFVTFSIHSFATLIYPGSFDPFHNTHFEEISAVMKAKPEEKVYILPIDKAYYNTVSKNLKAGFGTFLNFDHKREIISKYFPKEINQNIFIGNDLVNISNEIFATLRNVFRHYPDPKIVIGLDAFERWSSLDGFESFLGDHHIIISLTSDEYMHIHRLREKISEKFSRHFKKIEYIETVRDSIRSYGVNLNLFKNTWENISPLMHPDALAYLEKSSEVKELIESHVDRMRRYLLENNKSLLIPLIFSQVELDPSMRRRIMEEKNLSEISQILLSLNGRDTHAISQTSWRLFRYLQKKSLLDHKSKFYKNFYSIMMNIFLKPEIAGITSANYLTNQLVMAHESRPSKLLEGFSEMKDKTLSIAQILSWSLIWNGYKKLNAMANVLGYKDSSTYVFSNEHEPLWKSEAMPNKVIVYRGVTSGRHLEAFKKLYDQAGFVSKVALNAMLMEGKSIEEALEASQVHLESGKYKNAVVNHVIGNWMDKTALISTSFSKEVAIRSARVNGLVFTIEISLDKGLMASDPGYWNEYHSDGINPNTRLEEFIVMHQIPVENVLKIEEVKSEDMPTQPLAGSFEATWYTLKSLPWHISQCMRLFAR